MARGRMTTEGSCSGAHCDAVGVRIIQIDHVIATCTGYHEASAQVPVQHPPRRNCPVARRWDSDQATDAMKAVGVKIELCSLRRFG